MQEFNPFFRNQRNLKIYSLKKSDQVTKLQFRMWKKHSNNTVQHLLKPHTTFLH